ncbi:MAG: GTP pyrophosphokinase family protein [Ruminococcus sp.]|nr:GTP pyrophosphokinase family protein [Ruminococcus sp.]
MSDEERRENGQEEFSLVFGDVFHDVPDLRLPALTSSEVQLVYDHTKRIIGSMVEYRELMMMYTCAIKEVKTKFDVLNTEFNVRYRRNPIEFISTRLKRTSSIAEKLAKKGLALSAENIENNISDVAGVRVICAYIDDIYSIADALIKQDDITLIKRKDYIAEPKPNGYRSLHLIVSVPVFFAEERRDMRVEVQIRTIAMDFWASLEHQLKYKQVIGNQDEIVKRLKNCADVISDTDKEMLSIRSEIELAEDIPSEDDILFEKIKDFDVPIY